MPKKVTMQHIADALGITKVSVSKALNNQPGISDELRRQILMTAQKMDYLKTRPAASSPVALAFICPKRFFLEDDTFYTTIYYYINKLCTEQGYTITCFVINSADEMALRMPEKLTLERYDGLFIAGEFRHDYLDMLVRLPGSKVAVDFYVPSLKLDSVISNNFHLSQQVTDYLIAKGHREIGFVGDVLATSSICDRYFGYLKALRLRGIEPNPGWHIVNNDSVTGQYTVQFGLPDPLPTAFVCHCDKAAFTLMQRLDASGVKVPDTVSIISFDNTNLCSLMLPHLSSVNFDRRQIAEVSFARMESRINTPEAPIGISYIQGELIERDSVAERRETSKADDLAPVAGERQAFRSMR
jgi:LacI family transcriptional regulator